MNSKGISSKRKVGGEAKTLAVRERAMLIRMGISASVRTEGLFYFNPSIFAVKGWDSRIYLRCIKLIELILGRRSEFIRRGSTRPGRRLQYTPQRDVG